MFYKFRRKKPDGTWASGWVETSDCQVVVASPAWQPLLGRRIADVYDALVREGYTVKRSQYEDKKFEIITSRRAKLK